MHVSELPERTQDYLKILWNHEEKAGCDTAMPLGDLAKAAGQKLPTTSEAVKRLAAKGLVEHERYFGVRLVREGQSPEEIADTFALPVLAVRRTLALGNLLREAGVVERLADTSRNALINIVTIFLGLTVGSKLSAEAFLQLKTLGILMLGMVAFCAGTAAGVLMAKLMNVFSSNKINPLIGSAGVSAVPMAARVSNKVGLEANPQNFLLMHAMGPNVAGVIGSAVAAGVLLSFVG